MQGLSYYSDSDDEAKGDQPGAQGGPAEPAEAPEAPAQAQAALQEDSTKELPELELSAVPSVPSTSFEELLGILIAPQDQKEEILEAYEKAPPEGRQ